tara:strand:+ start:6436 stop:6999 length:564 start_codon:yes stop_codon:yes gene_type:complete
MSIEIKFDSPEEQKAPEKKKSKNYNVSLDIRRTIDGKIIIRDHTEIDIVLMPDKMKVLLFPKEMSSQIGYDTQLACLKFLNKKGLIKFETIRSGNIFNSLEAEIPQPQQPDKVDPIQLTIFAISIFVEEDRENFAFAKKIRDEFEKRLVDPPEEESTELGEVPHGPRKGSMNVVQPPYFRLYENKEG